ncbi:biosynthetic peptidoglycan transglycosylase [Nibrella saemangeumensis]|uniref:Biosynthetic peptidoglycan transglycosylase n=1 Tax=Nibrella saemangeumensis TaxID=1084526 RepID=A0ABP8NGS5_9BACT
MLEKRRKALKITIWTLIALFVLGSVGAGVAYSKRERLLQAGLERGIRKAKRDYNLDVRIGLAHFSNPTTVAFNDISVVPAGRDSLLRIDRAEISVRFWPLLIGNIRLADLKLENGMVQVVKRDSLTNIDFLLKRSRDTTNADKKRADLSKVAENLVDNVLSKIPDDFDVRNLDLRFIDDEHRVSLLTIAATIDDEIVNSMLKLNGSEATWHVTGRANPDERQYNLALYADGQPLELSYLQNKFNIKLQADTVRAELNESGRSGGVFRMKGSGSVRNMRVNHPAIARHDVLVERAAMDANLFVGENYVGVDSSSTVYLGEVSARPFVKYTLSPDKIYDLQLHTDMVDAQALFNAFPQGLFESLEGMKVAGKLKYDLALHLDTSQPDSVKFDSGLQQDNFRILQMGKTDFTMINRPFDHTPYENGQPVRTFRVGPENPDFTPLQDISPNMRNALLTSEDYTFFTHKGFNEKAFRVSIATNYKAKSFKRGASTVSMQLVKNVFLSRQKTMARKVEEILIVWLIENERLVSKERMYEVYLNIIEWGRNIYGIGEAARFYFAKHPSELTLGESIFLAFVVPRPKAALNHFNPDGTLRSYVRGYHRLIGKIMARRGMAQPDTNAYGFYTVQLREGLRQQVEPSDSLQIEDMMNNDEPTDGGGLLDAFRNLFRGDKKTEREETLQVESETTNQPAATDTVKTRKQLRQERREQRRREREERKRQGDGGLF